MKWLLYVMPSTRFIFSQFSTLKPEIPKSSFSRLFLFGCTLPLSPHPLIFFFLVTDTETKIKGLAFSQTKPRSAAQSTDNRRHESHPRSPKANKIPDFPNALLGDRGAGAKAGSETCSGKQCAAETEERRKSWRRNAQCPPYLI